MTTTEDQTGSITPPVGDQLRTAREASGQTIDQVAKALALRTDQITSLEDSAWDRLPAATFTAGFIRSYARHFNLDATALSNQYRSEIDEAPAGPALVFPEPEEEQQVSTGLLLGAALGLALLTYGAWMVFSGDNSLITEDDNPPAAISDDRSTLPGPADPQDPMAAAQAAMDDTLAGTTDGQSPATMPEEISADDPAMVDRPVLTDQDDDVIEDMGNAAAQTPAPATQNQTATAEVAPATSPSPASSGSVDYDTVRIVLRATSDSWMQVKDNDKVILTRILATGDSFEVPPRRNLRLLTGNAGGTVIEVDGTALPGLGSEGVVVRNILLDPDRLLKGLYY